MLDKKLLATGISLLVVCIVAVTAAQLLGGEPEAPKVTDAPVSEVTRPRIFAPQQAPQREREYLYIIREYEGRVAVFGQDPDIPEMILEMFVRHLPAYDQMQLREGVRVYSKQELDARIEDYTS